MHAVRYSEGIRELMATPPGLPTDFKPDIDRARRIAEAALAEGRTWLDPIEANAVLEAYGIPVAPVLLARNEDEAAAAAAPLLAASGAIVAKILSPDVIHKSEVGGVRLNLGSEQAVRRAFREIVARTLASNPQARVTGVTIIR